MGFEVEKSTVRPEASESETVNPCVNFTGRSENQNSAGSVPSVTGDSQLSFRLVPEPAGIKAEAGMPSFMSTDAVPASASPALPRSVKELTSPVPVKRSTRAPQTLRKSSSRPSDTAIIAQAPGPKLPGAQVCFDCRPRRTVPSDEMVVVLR